VCLVKEPIFFLRAVSCQGFFLARVVLFCAQHGHAQRFVLDSERFRLCCVSGGLPTDRAFVSSGLLSSALSLDRGNVLSRVVE
jgi:hypothetical protein